MPLFGSFAVPTHGLAIVLIDTLSHTIHIAYVVLCIYVIAYLHIQLKGAGVVALIVGFIGFRFYGKDIDCGSRRGIYGFRLLFLCISRRDGADSGQNHEEEAFHGFHCSYREKCVSVWGFIFPQI